MRILLVTSILCCCSAIAYSQGDSKEYKAPEPKVIFSHSGDLLFVKSQRGIAKIITKDEAENLSESTIDYISVLKDPSAIHIYGDKGKNGVVLIVMKNEAARAKVSPRKKQQRTYPSSAEKNRG